MSFLRALRAYIGLGPDEDIEDRYLYELNSRRRELDLDEIEAEEAALADGELQLETEHDDVVIVTPGSNGRAGSRRAGRSDLVGARRSENRASSPVDIDLTESSGASGRDIASGRDLASREETDYVTEADFSSGSKRRKREIVSYLDTSSEVQDADEFADEMARLRESEFGDYDDAESGLDAAAEDGDDVLDFIDDDSFAEYIPRRRGDEPIAQQRQATNGSRTAKDQSAEPEEAVVRSLDSMRAKPRTLIPESFADAKLVADEFKRDIPVLLNLQGLERELARRLIDFASGICYALDGSMEKIASQVFLLIPESVEVSEEDRRRIEERGYAR